MSDNTPIDFKYVDNLWDDEKAKSMSALERLVYRSNLLGSDQRITNTGGGNTSSKVIEKDPITGADIDVIWIKGSGGDLRTAKPANFASLEIKKLFELQDLYNSLPDKGLKTLQEDRMMELMPHCTFNRNPRPGSIETPTHAFMPAKHIAHTHPNALIAIAASKNSKELTEQIFGGEIGWIPWMRPGFELGLMVQREVENNPSLKGMIWGQHGFITWGDDDKQCYLRTLKYIEKASEYIESKDKGAKTFGGQKYSSLNESARNELLTNLLPWLRGQVSQYKRFVGTVQSDDAMMRFINSNHAPRLSEMGTSCPDHFLRTKIKPLYVDWNPQKEDIDSLKDKLKAGLKQYRQDYTDYYQSCKHDNSPAMRDSNPTVILIPGIGLISFGKNKSESRVTAEFYGCAVEVMRGTEAIGEYVAWERQEAFDIEYWLLEEAKLERMPPEKELARQISVVVGAGSGIGKATAHRLIKEDAHIVCADVNEDAAKQTAKELTDIYGQGIGVAGTGISSCGPAIGTEVDITNRQSIQKLIETTLLAYGAIDHIVVTAGIFAPPDKSGHISDEKWKLSFDVNVRGAYNLLDEFKPILEAQGLETTATLTTSVNGAVSKKGSVGYDTSKAAANHLVREMAIELAPLTRVNAIAPATVIKGSTMFPRDRVIASLTKYDIEFENSESDDALRNKLAKFYAKRTLLNAPITAEDQAEATYFLITKRSSKTTGQIINVDGGLHEAFLR